MANLVSELKKLATESSLPVSSLLKKALMVASKIQHQDFEAWIMHELDGYSDTAEFPEYRFLHGYVAYLDPYQPTGWQQICFEDKAIANKLSKRPFGQRIVEIESIVGNRTPGSVISQKLPPSFELRLVQSLDLTGIPTYVIQYSSLVGVLDAVRTRVLCWTLELEKAGIVCEDQHLLADEQGAVKKNILEGQYSTVAISDSQPNDPDDAIPSICIVASPLVFIMYAQESEEHNQRVLRLAQRLRTDGVNCNIDQFIQQPPEGWPKWMLSQIKSAAFVLVVCTETLLLRFEGKEKRGKGLGATWEGSVATQLLYESGGINSKFVPVLFEGFEGKRVPLALRAATRYLMLRDYEKLLRHLTGQPAVIPEPLGQVPVMPPKVLSSLQDGINGPIQSCGMKRADGEGRSPTSAVVNYVFSVEPEIPRDYRGSFTLSELKSAVLKAAFPSAELWLHSGALFPLPVTSPPTPGGAGIAFQSISRGFAANVKHNEELSLSVVGDAHLHHVQTVDGTANRFVEVEILLGYLVYMIHFGDRLYQELYGSTKDMVVSACVESPLGSFIHGGAVNVKSEGNPARCQQNLARAVGTYRVIASSARDVKFYTKVSSKVLNSIINSYQFPRDGIYPETKQTGPGFAEIEEPDLYPIVREIIGSINTGKSIIE